MASLDGPHTVGNAEFQELQGVKFVPVSRLETVLAVSGGLGIPDDPGQTVRAQDRGASGRTGQAQLDGVQRQGPSSLQILLLVCEAGARAGHDLARPRGLVLAWKPDPDGRDHRHLGLR